MATTITGGVRTFTFGPGSLESITVRVWSAPNTAGRRKIAQVVGSYRVYGELGEYNVHIDERIDEWATNAARDDRSPLWCLFDMTDPKLDDVSKEDAAADLAHTAINWALEDWTEEEETA